MEVAQLHPLATIDLFSGLGQNELGAIERHVRVRQVRAGQTLVGYQDDSHDLFFLLSGKLKVTIFSEAGREVAFRELSAGQSFGELSAIDGQPRSANVIALTNSSVGSMTAPDFVSVLRHHPDIALATLRKLTTLVRLLTSRVEEGTNKVEVRVCHELLRLAREHPLNDNAARVRPAPKHADIANRINTHREAVTRLLGKLSKLGVVQKGRGELVIRDIKALATYAKQQHGS